MEVIFVEIVMEGTSGLHSSVSHPVNDISVRENPTKGFSPPPPHPCQCGKIQPNLSLWGDTEKLFFAFLDELDHFRHILHIFKKCEKKNPFRPPHPLSVELSTLFFLP